MKRGTLSTGNHRTTSLLRSRAAKFSLVAAASLGLLAGGTAALASTSPSPAAAGKTVVATTHITGRPDSGVHGNTWALDSITRVATLRLVSEVALSYCGGSTSTGHCYHFTGHINDTGTATTIAGQTVPGNGGLNGGSAPVMGVSIKAAMTGTLAYNFYSSWKTFSAASVEKTENDQGNTPGGEDTSGAWMEQFFGSGARFFVASAPATYLAGNGSWTYTAGFGADSACPNVASKWIDGSPNWGTDASAGNILAPDASAC